MRVYSIGLSLLVCATFQCRAYGNPPCLVRQLVAREDSTPQVRIPPGSALEKTLGEVEGGAFRFG